MKPFTLLLGILCILLSASLSFSGTIDPDIPDSKYLEYGEKFVNTVQICCFDGKGMSCGSAVIIDPHWIITAAHVVENCHEWTIKIKDKPYKLSKVIPHPDYDTNQFGYADLALGYSEEKLVLDFYPELYEEKNETGKICCMAGWGITGNFNTGAVISDSKRRAGSNFIDGIERKVLLCSPSKKHIKNEKPTELEYLTASGDSGGGLFIDGKLAGIHSSVVAVDQKPNSSYTDQSCHTRISLYTQWIKKHIKNNEKK